MKLMAKDVKGLNYQPGYSSCTFETWRCFNYEQICAELENGKKCFPNWNTVRIWLSWNAFCRGEKVFLDRVDMVIRKCKELGIYVMPVIFNRWHDSVIDCDGIYLDHFMPKAGWFDKYGDPFEKYIKALMERFGDDEGILCWDLCNEPFSFPIDEFEYAQPVIEQELKWLNNMYNHCKKFGAKQPVGIGDSGNLPLIRINDFCDVFMSHCYFRPENPYDENGIALYEAAVKSRLEEAKLLGKELIPNESGWGDFTDERRVQRVKVTLDVFKKYDMGYCLHALNHSDFTDLHDPEEGALSPDIGNLCFINKNGQIRPGHDILNKYW